MREVEAVATFREIFPHLTEDDMHGCFEERYIRQTSGYVDPPPDDGTADCQILKWGEVGWTRDHILQGESLSETPLSFTPTWSVGQTMSSGVVYMPWLMQGYECCPLHMAVVAGDEALVDELMETMSGTLLNYRDSLGNTVLMMACASRSSKHLIKQLFRKAGSPVQSRQLLRATNYEGLTALHFAVINARPDLVKLLLKRGADPNAGTTKFEGTRCGMTPLLVCVSLIYADAKEKMMACARFLLWYGADPNIPGLESLDQKCDDYVICYECNCGGCWSRQFGLSVPRLVPPNCLTDHVVRKSGGMLHLALRMNLDVRIIRELMDLSKVPIDLEAYNGAGLTLLGVAVTNRNRRVASLFIQRGASVTAQNIYSDGATRLSPLHKMIATSSSYFHQLCFPYRWYSNEELAQKLSEAMKELLELLTPKDLETQDSLGRTPLVIAAQYYSFTACQLLLEAGANPLAVDGSKRSPLFYVCYKRDDPYKEQLLDLFVRHGAGRDVPQSPYNHVNSPLRAVFRHKDRATLRRLFLAGAVTATHLRAMINDLQQLPPQLNQVQATRVSDFTETVRTLLARCPRSLQDQCLYKVAALLPPASPEDTAKNMDDVGLPHMKDRMRQLGLM